MGERYDSGAQAPGIGYREEQIHPASGLRIAHCGGVLGTNLAGIQALRTFEAFITDGGANLASSATWQSLKTAATWKGRLPIPMTPAINIIATVSDGSGTALVRFRATGFDQFGTKIVEVTPWLSLVTTSVAFYQIIYLSKVFSFLDDLEFMADDLLGTGQVGVGWTAMPSTTKAEAATISVSLAGAGASNTSVIIQGDANWGIGTPLRIEPYGADQPFAKPEVMGAGGALLYSSYGPTVIGTPAKFPLSTSAVDGIALGQNASTWQGCPHKIGFSFTQGDSFDIELGGSSQSASQVPATLAQLGADTLELCFSIRSTVGTRRGQRAAPQVYGG